MPKLKSSISNVFDLFTPQIDDPKVFVSGTKDLVSRPEEDNIVVPITDKNLSEYIDPTQIIHQAATYLSHPGTVAGTGITDKRIATHVQLLTGNALVAKYQSSRKGTFSIAPFGLVFSQVADNYADAQFTTAISDAYPTLVGDPVKAAAFIAYEARLTRAVANALNRELAYSDGNTQSVRLAQLYCYHRDLLWLQEVVNGVARNLGWYEFQNKLVILNPNLSSTGLLQDPEFYSRVETLARVVSQFKTMDPDTHTTLQFLNDYKIHEKEYFRAPVVHRPSVMISSPFKTNAALVENITNAIPIPYRLTVTELNLVVGTSGKVLHIRDLITQDWVDAMMYSVTKAKALAALDEVILLAHGMIENYKDVLKYLNTVEGKKIAVLDRMDKFLYFDGQKITPVQPYFSYTDRAIDNGLPLILNVEGSTPSPILKFALHFTTGAMSPVGLLQQLYATNFASWGVTASEKLDSTQEMFWQVWVPYSYGSEAGVNAAGLFQFVNPFNGLTYMPDTSYAYITAATSIKMSHPAMSIDGVQCVGLLGGVTAASKAFIPFVQRSDTGYATGMTLLDLNSALFGTPTTDTKQEKHDELYTQLILQYQVFGSKMVNISSKNTASEVGICSVKPTDLDADNFYVPCPVAYVSQLASKYYAECFPSIDFQKSVASQK